MLYIAPSFPTKAEPMTENSDILSTEQQRASNMQARHINKLVLPWNVVVQAGGDAKFIYKVERHHVRKAAEMQSCVKIGKKDTITSTLNHGTIRYMQP